MIDKLIELSKIFKDGFTVELKDGEINQYTNYNKPFIVSYKTIIEIRSVITTYNKNLVIPDNCNIGGWFDNDISTYFIELNQTFKYKKDAILFAKKYNQKAIYNTKSRKVIYL